MRICNLIKIFTIFVATHAPGWATAEEDDYVKTVVFGASPELFDFLVVFSDTRQHGAGSFSKTGSWSYWKDADVIGVIVKDQEDIAVAPAVFYELFVRLTNSVHSSVYKILPETFGEKLDSTVVFIMTDKVGDELMKKVGSLEKESYESNSSFHSCFNAGLIFSNSGRFVEYSFSNLAKMCREWVSLG